MSRLQFGERLKKLSITQRRTLRAAHLIERGLHPFGMSLKSGNETCGTCAHLFTQGGANIYFKCRKMKSTRGPATDLRLKWPACVLWKSTTGDPIVDRKGGHHGSEETGGAED